MFEPMRARLASSCSRNGIIAVADGPHLARRHVHVVDVGREDVVDLAALAPAQHAVLGHGAVRAEGGVRLRDDVQVLLIGRQVVDLVGHLALDDLAVRGLDEAERVDARERRQRTDQTDVRAFRGLDRAHAPVVRRVDVADLEAGPLARETTGAKRRQPALVSQARQRVRLVHELRQLRRAEELLDRGHHRADVDQGLRRDRLDVLGGHPLTHHALHARQARADLVLDEFAHGAQPAVAEVVDVVGLALDLAARALDCRETGVQADEVLDGRDDVLERQDALLEGQVEGQLLVDLVAADLGEVVALRVEVEVVEQVARVLDRGGFARTQLAVDVEEASSWLPMLSFSSVAMKVSYWPKRSRISSAVMPRAFRSTDTGCLRLRSTRTRRCPSCRSRTRARRRGSG
jgi:hypothetical protein